MPERTVTGYRPGAFQPVSGTDAGRAVELAIPATRLMRYWFEKMQASAPELVLQELPGHHHALDLAGALADLGGRRPVGSYRR
jgi:hypothetical protein